MEDMIVLILILEIVLLIISLTSFVFCAIAESRIYKLKEENRQFRSMNALLREENEKYDILKRRK